ncbi:MAG: hypothetical protein WC659_01805 [Patescibacteria group bacterium]
MTKLIRLKVSRIKYTGDSIGDDIRIEVESLNKFVGLNMRLKRGSDRALNVEIGQFFGDGVSFALPVTIRIIERDLVFNDVGSVQKTIKVNLSDPSSQRNIYTIEVRERRGYLTRKKAVFEVTLEAGVSDTILYVADESGDGWVVTVPEHGTENISLPYHLKISLEKYDTKRQYFKIMEGIIQGTKASVQIESNGTSHLRTENPHTGSAHLTYSLSRGTLKMNRNVYKVLNFPQDPEPWKNGLYDIEIPDAPHEPGEAYLDRARLAKVWFRVGHGGERYLHTGSVTLGCITLTEVERWDYMCKVLMKARKGDGESIGVLEITD